MSDYSRFSINLALNVFNITLNIELPENKNRQLVNDSRALQQGDIFVATIGHLSDGREYIESAIDSGADLVIAQTETPNEHGNVVTVNKVNVVHFYELNTHLSALASLYYQQPQNKLVSIGITGTNGKTTTSQIIAQLLQANEQSCAVIGTNGAGMIDNLQPINNTTPGPTELNRLLSEFVADGVSHVAMEVSSHALDQRRITASSIDVAVFTNLSRDHLDYHQTLEKYADAKFSIFTQSSAQIAVVNGDDDVAKKWLSSWSSEQAVYVYGLDNEVTKHALYVHASNITHHGNGVEFTLNTHLGSVKVKCGLVGEFNISNVLASAAVLLSQSYSLEKIKIAIAQLKPVIGRMEIFSSPNMPTSIVDYAHTPDALENALKACRNHCEGKLWVVFGCGGDRDNGKRAQMGNIAERYADHVVVTNDNPRTESPENIVNDILKGCTSPEKVDVIYDRKQAVLNTLAKAEKNDTILFAGKGHEDYIVIGRSKISYNERGLVQSAYTNKAVS